MRKSPSQLSIRQAAANRPVRHGHVRLRWPERISQSTQVRGNLTKSPKLRTTVNPTLIGSFTVVRDPKTNTLVALDENGNYVKY